MVCQGFDASSVRRFEMKECAVIYAALAILVALIVPCCMANLGRGGENGFGVVLSLALTEVVGASNCCCVLLSLYNQL